MPKLAGLGVCPNTLVWFGWLGVCPNTLVWCWLVGCVSKHTGVVLAGWVCVYAGMWYVVFHAVT